MKAGKEKTFSAGSVKYSAKHPVRWYPTPLTFMQMCLSPLRQLGQYPHVMCPSPLTLSPICRFLTFFPTSAISPTNSCPMIKGTGTFFCAQGPHLSMFKSVPQIDVLRILIKTSLSSSFGIGESSIHKPGLEYFFTMLLI